MWVPATPEGNLMEQIRKALERTEPPKGTSMKLVQKGGRKTSSSLVRSNPFPIGHCGRKKCQICEQEGEEGSGGRCYEGGICYRGSCNRCPKEGSGEEGSRTGTAGGQKRTGIRWKSGEGGAIKEGKESIYIGESSRTLFRRTEDHFSDYMKKDKDSWMWNHVRKEHLGEIRGNGRKDFHFKRIRKYKEATTRIAGEAVYVAREERGVGDLTKEGSPNILNSKEEFHKTKDVRIYTTQL
jgi:hypothetical protein